MDHSQTTCVELCAGYGGICLGLKRAIPTLRVIATCEIEAFAVANLVAKMEAGLLDRAPIWTNLKDFPWWAFRGRVDILVGGYPCQPFSAAGKRLGKDDPRHLWPWIADGIAAMQPAACFFENVEGHISMGLRDVMQDLGKLGYRSTWGIFSAAEIGAPHQRKRVFILAHRADSGWGQDRQPAELRASVPLRPSGDSGLPDAPTFREIWPSRPGERQFPWEPPRTVGGQAPLDDSQERGLRLDGHDAGQTAGNVNAVAGASDGGGKGASLFRSLLAIRRAGLAIERCPDEPGRFHISGYGVCCDARGVEGIARQELDDAGMQESGRLSGIGREEVSAAGKPSDESLVHPQGERPPARGAQHAGQRGEQAAAKPGVGQGGNMGHAAEQRQPERGSAPLGRSEPEQEHQRPGCGMAHPERAGVQQGPGIRAGDGRRGPHGQAPLPSRGSEDRPAEHGKAFAKVGRNFDESADSLGETLTLNPYGDNVSAYEYISNKTRARNILFSVWKKACSQAIQWTPGGLRSFLAEEILQSGMQLDSFTQRICYFIWCVQTGHKAQGWGLRGMWVYESCRNTPQGQEPFEQFKRELGYALCQLSYEIALERGQSAVEAEGILQGVREASERAWALSDALPEMEEVWRSSLDQAVWEKGAYVEATATGNRTDELRLLGNGVVPAVAEKAWRVLSAELEMEYTEREVK